MELALRRTLLEARPLSEARLEEGQLAPLRRQERREERRQAVAPDGGVAEQMPRGREVAHLPGDAGTRGSCAKWHPSVARAKYAIQSYLSTDN